MARAGSIPDSLLVTTHRVARVMPVNGVLILIVSSQSVFRGDPQVSLKRHAPVKTEPGRGLKSHCWCDCPPLGGVSPTKIIIHSKGLNRLSNRSRYAHTRGDMEKKCGYCKETKPDWEANASQQAV